MDQPPLKKPKITESAEFAEKLATAMSFVDKDDNFCGIVKISSKYGHPIVCFSQKEIIYKISLNTKIPLVAFDQEKNIVIYDFLNNIPLKTFLMKEYIYAIKFSPDGKYLAFAGQEAVLYLYDIQSDVLRTFRGHTYCITSVIWDFDSKYVISACEEGIINTYSIANLSLESTKVQDSGIDSMSISNNNILVSCDDGGNIFIYDISNGLTYKIKTTIRINLVAIHSDGTKLAIVDCKNNVSIYNLSRTCLELFDLEYICTLTPSYKNVSIVSIIWDGDLLLTNDGNNHLVHIDYSTAIESEIALFRNENHVSKYLSNPADTNPAKCMIISFSCN